MNFGCECPQGESLCEALRRVVSEYEVFVKKSVPAETRDIAARHAAGKAMVGHLGALAKLVHWWSMAGDEVPTAEGDGLSDVLTAARNAISGYGAEAE